ncbi:MAG: Nitrogen regulation protein [Myxococcaceae bacterium]|nr:Nitrogen regulation protein [Myxococcaceae bacterium]
MVSVSPDSPQVAVLDDDVELRAALGSLLRSSGLVVREYGSVEDYLGSSRGDPDCLIVDVSMPGRSGPELVRQLRSEGRSVPAIFISASELPCATAWGSAGVPFFRKPFGDELLLSAVRSALGSANTEARSNRVSDVPKRSEV